MNKFNFKKGFTLIELMVVSAIIILVAAIIIPQLSESRNKSADAAVKANLDTIRAQAELFYANNNNSYLPAGGSIRTIASCPAYVGPTGTNMLTHNKTIADAIAEAVKRGGSYNSCANSSTTWAAAVSLKTDSNKSWCVDSGGRSKQYPGGAFLAIQNNNPTFYCK